MPCRVGGAFPSLSTRRISSSGTVIHESGPDKRTLAYSGQLYRFTTCPPLVGPPRPTFKMEPLTRPPADLAGHRRISSSLLRDSRRPPAPCGDFRPILVRDLRGMERSRRSLCQTHLLICRAFTGATGLEPATSGVTGVTRAFHPASSSRIMRAVIRLLRLFVPPSTVRSFA